MFLLVDPVLSGIPFKTHRYTYCITVDDQQYPFYRGGVRVLARMRRLAASTFPLTICGSSAHNPRSNYDVFRRRVRLSLLEKSWIVVRALVT